MAVKKYILPITPRSWVNFRSGKGGNSSLFYIPLECKSRHRVTGKEEDKGKPCDIYLDGDIFCGHTNEDGKWISHTLSKKGRQNKENIEKYNKYRMDLFHIAKMKKFQLQVAGMAIYYHFPVPARWTKKKKAAMHGQLKLSKADFTNLDKAFEDALTGKDEAIAHKAGQGKYWFLPELVEPALRLGFIEICTGLPVYNPYNVELINPYQAVEMEDITSRREKLQQRKQEIKEKKNADLPKRTPKPLKIISQNKLFKKDDKIK